MTRRWREQEVEDLLALSEDFEKGCFVVKNSISVALGAQKAIELDPATGAVIVLDSERGVTLAPAEALRALRFLATHEEMIGLSSFLATIADEGREQLEVL